MIRLLRLFHTLRPLRWRQWWYRGWHPVAKRLATPYKGAAPDDPETRPVALFSWPVPASFDPRGNTFMFVNRRHAFGGAIDWAYAGEGPLWGFNLQYFEWLYDERLSAGDRLQTMRSFCAGTHPGRELPAYPTSLRIMAWIWFGLRYRVPDDAIRNRLYQDADWLRRFPEYRLDGNHLFENAIALSTAGAYFRCATLTRRGERLLRACINEQVCADGGHCEGSPMYHSLLLWRMLQCLEILRACGSPGTLEALVADAAGRMLGWLRAVTFSDGSWPAVNDAVAGVAPAPGVLFNAATALGLAFAERPLGDSGYRMIRMPEYELFIDVGGIMPAWQPGHAHADTGNFCLQVRGRPIVVDTGASSYEDPVVRAYQRGSAAHNVLVVNGRDGSELWSRFRVGRRCRVLDVVESPHRIEISYVTAAGHRLRRSFDWDKDGITIADSWPDAAGPALLHLHLHPDIDLSGDGSLSGDVLLTTTKMSAVKTSGAAIALGFNVLRIAACLLLVPDGKSTSFRLAINHKGAVNGA